jgi:pyroglutamyl-peptidase
MRVLLTGFEPFGGSPINPSQQLVTAMAEARREGIEICPLVLPVDGALAPAAVVAAMRARQPDVVLCLGQATGRAVISIERITVNLLDYSIPDNAGRLATDEPVVAGGPAAYFATAPVREMLAAIRAAGVPSELSLSAGAYLCNQVFYTVLHHCATNGLVVRAGFIHLPALPEQVVGTTRATPSMSMGAMMVGVREALNACIQ